MVFLLVRQLATKCEAEYATTTRFLHRRLCRSRNVQLLLIITYQQRSFSLDGSIQIYASVGTRYRTRAFVCIVLFDHVLHYGTHILQIFSLLRRANEFTWLAKEDRLPTFILPVRTTGRRITPSSVPKSRGGLLNDPVPPRERTMSDIRGLLEGPPRLPDSRRCISISRLTANKGGRLFPVSRLRTGSCPQRQFTGARAPRRQLARPSGIP